MKVIILILAYLLLVIPSQAAEKQVEHQKGQPEEIEKYISLCRHEIENYYRDQFVELKQRAESEIRLLEVADKAVYAGLAEQAEVAKTVLHINSCEYRAPWYREAKTERMLQLKELPVRFAVAESRIAERKNDILAKLKWGTLNLERQKEYALNVELVELEKRLKEDMLRAEPEPTHGVVTGLVYAQEAPSAIIDGKIVHEADTIHGVKVVKIHRDKVEFEKNSSRWAQKVREAPEAYWK